MAKRTSALTTAAVKRLNKARNSNRAIARKKFGELAVNQILGISGICEDIPTIPSSNSSTVPHEMANVDNFSRPTSTAPTDDWRSGCTLVKELWSKAQMNNKFCDVSLLVGPEDSATLLKAHKVFLACASPVFEAMFFGDLAVVGDQVPLPGDDPEAFNQLLNYVYGRQVFFSSFCSAMKTYALAEKYLIPELQTTASTYMGGIMNDSDFWDVMKADLFCDTTFKDMCINYISKNASRLLLLQSFFDVPKELVEVILKIDNIQIKEIHLLKSVTRWCYTNITDEKSRKAELQNFFSFIRFANLDAPEFCEFMDEFPEAIDTESCLNLLKYYNCPDRYSLPPWCSSNTERRFSGDDYSSYSNFSVADSDDMDSDWDMF